MRNEPINYWSVCVLLTRLLRMRPAVAVVCANPKIATTTTTTIITTHATRNAPVPQHDARGADRLWLRAKACGPKQRLDADRLETHAHLPVRLRPRAQQGLGVAGGGGASRSRGNEREGARGRAGVCERVRVCVSAMTEKAERDANVRCRNMAKCNYRLQKCQQTNYA
jgi:hypothetical protein